MIAFDGGTLCALLLRENDPDPAAADRPPLLVVITAAPGNENTSLSVSAGGFSWACEASAFGLAPLEAAASAASSRAAATAPCPPAAAATAAAMGISGCFASPVEESSMASSCHAKACAAAASPLSPACQEPRLPLRVPPSSGATPFGSAEGLSAESVPVDVYCRSLRFWLPTLSVGFCAPTHCFTRSRGPTGSCSAASSSSSSATGNVTKAGKRSAPSAESAAGKRSAPSAAAAARCFLCCAYSLRK